MVRSYYEDYDSSSWKIIGLFTNKDQAEEIAKKWKEFYLEKRKLFNEPKDWVDPDDPNETWSDSDEYMRRTVKYSDVYNFKDIEVEEFDFNKEMILGYPETNDDMRSLMTQWDREYKLEKIIK